MVSTRHRAAARRLGTAGVLGSVAVALAASLGCGRRQVPSEAPARGSFGAVIERSVRRAQREPAGPLSVVLFSDAEAIGVDPHSGEQRWRHPVRVFGKPTSYGQLVVVPVHGHRLLALDAGSGDIQWEAKLPGQALTGVSMSERWVIATVLSGRAGSRSKVVVLSALDGHVMWSRESRSLLGVPLAVGRTGFVPVDDDVVVLALPTGRRIARMDPPGIGELQRIEQHGEVIVAANRRSYVDLSAAQEGHRIRSRDAPAFEAVDGIEPGIGHADGIQLRVMAGAAPGAPREALYLGRRVVMALRLDRYGRPIEARWVHVRYDQEEYLQMHLDGRRVLLLRTDGALVWLGAEHGRVLSETEDTIEPRGAAFAGGERARALPPSTADPRGVGAKLLGILEDPDPRLLPAQKLAVDLLWRNRDPEIRGYAIDLATGRMRPGEDAQSLILRERAQRRIDGPWGPATPASLADLQKTLSAPTKLDELQWKLATGEVVQAGSAGAVHRLVELLFDPATPPGALVEIARALRDLDDSRALLGVSRFVTQYHADPEVVRESDAIFYALEYLIAQAQPTHPHRIPKEAQVRAQETLRTILESEMSTDLVQRFIEERYYPLSR